MLPLLPVAGDSSDSSIHSCCSCVVDDLVEEEQQDLVLLHPGKQLLGCWTVWNCHVKVEGCNHPDDEHSHPQISQDLPAVEEDQWCLEDLDMDVECEDRSEEDWCHCVESIRQLSWYR